MFSKMLEKPIKIAWILCPMIFSSKLMVLLARIMIAELGVKKKKYKAIYFLCFDTLSKIKCINNKNTKTY